MADPLNKVLLFATANFIGNGHYQIRVDFFLVLESMPSSFHVHLFGVGVVELAGAQFTVETETNFNRHNFYDIELKQFTEVLDICCDWFQKKIGCTY